jgi:HTH-type transcriptional regulator/antitoxin HigA
MQEVVAHTPSDRVPSSASPSSRVHDAAPSAGSQRPEFRDSLEAIRFYVSQKGLTQRDLVPMIGSRSKVSEVLSGRRAITMPMARALHRHLGIPAEDLLKEPAVRTEDAEAQIDWRRFPLNEMAKRGWIEGKDNLREHAEELVSGLMRKAGLSELPAALYRKNDQNRANAMTNPYALSAWCLKVLAEANQRELASEYEPDNPVDILGQVAKLSPASDGPRRAVEFLAEHGIAVEIVPHLPGTHLDGAAIKSAQGRPVIGMTLRYDRIDNFWFVLSHELAHAILHLSGDTPAFIDDLKLDSTSNEEREADKLASEALIPEDVWESSGIAQNLSPMAVIALAHQIGIHPAIVAGRVRHKLQDYRLLSQFVGTKEVKCLFDT